MTGGAVELGGSTHPALPLYPALFAIKRLNGSALRPYCETGSRTRLLVPSFLQAFGLAIFHLVEWVRHVFRTLAIRYLPPYVATSHKVGLMMSLLRLNSLHRREVENDQFLNAVFCMTTFPVYIC